MLECMYSAWFRDEKFAADDDGGEWVAIANTPDAAIGWGDRIAKRYVTRVGEPFIRSYLEPPSGDAHCDGSDAVPRVVDGDDSVDPFASE